MYQYSEFHRSITLIQKIKNLDYPLIIMVLLLGVISFFMMYSVDEGKILHHTKTHFTKFVIFFPLMIFFSMFHIKLWHRVAYLSYLTVLVLLVWVEFFGFEAGGSQRWIDLKFINLQPSELMKLCLILCLAKYYHKIKINNVNKFFPVFNSMIIIFLPMVLVINQPDMGTSILLGTSGIIVLWLSGLKIKYFFYTFLGLLISLPFIFSYLKEYQKLRILTFIDPNRDPLGSGYHIIQSKIAVGSGGFDGKGFLKGTQSNLEFLPEKETDFIFTLFAEQFGFIGSVILLLIYGGIIYRIIKIGLISRNHFSKLFCYGFSFTIFLNITVNMLMVLGLLPVVGSPLPILSYGGSSMLTMMIGFSIVLSAKINSKISIP